jgi:hypothetical protein
MEVNGHLELVASFVGFDGAFVFLEKAFLEKEQFINVEMEAAMVGNFDVTSNRFAPFRWFMNLFRKKH